MQGLYSGRISNSLEIRCFMLMLFPYYHGVDVILHLKDIINMHYNPIHGLEKDKKLILMDGGHGVLKKP